MYYVGNIPCVETDIRHYGIPGMSWGKRRFQNEDGTYTNAGLLRYFGKHDRASWKEQERSFNNLTTMPGLRDRKHGMTSSGRLADFVGGPKNGLNKDLGGNTSVGNKAARSFGERAGKALSDVQRGITRAGERVNAGFKDFSKKASARLGFNGDPASKIRLGTENRYHWGPNGNPSKPFKEWYGNKSGVPSSSMNSKSPFEPISRRDLGAGNKSAFNSIRQKGSVAISRFASNPDNLKIAVGVLAGTAAVGVGIAVARRIAKRSAEKKSKQKND